MLKSILLTLPALFVAIGSFSQRLKEVTVKPGQNPSKAFLVKDKYRFEEFQDGYIITPEGKRTKPMKVNFNLFSGLPQFIDEKGDTLFVDEHIVEYVHMKGAIYFHNSSREYYEIIVNSSPVKLAVSKYWRITRVETEYQDPRDGQTTKSTARSMSNQVYSPTLGKMIRNENTVYRRDSVYFFINSKGKVSKANEANILKLFPDRKKKISEYVDQSAVDFKKEDDLKLLFERCLSTF